MKALASILSLVAAAAFAGDGHYYPPDVSPWATRHLTAMKEPSLFTKGKKATREEYRFLWLRTFDKPIAIRIWREGSAARMRVVRLSGAGGYEPGHIESDTAAKVTSEDWKRFLDCIAKAQFWQIATKESPEKLGFDGSQWILEGRDASKYHVVDRWTPGGGYYADCCRFLITLAKLKIPKDEFYCPGKTKLLTESNRSNHAMQRTAPRSDA